MRCLLALSLVALTAVSIEAGLQNITVKGVAICNKKRIPNIAVRLMEHDLNSPDDTLHETTTDEQGVFSIYGEESEVFTIDPYLIIVHSCNVKPGCQRHSKYVIDKKWVGGTYDMTYVPLDIVQHGETTECS